MLNRNDKLSIVLQAYFAVAITIVALIVLARATGFCEPLQAITAISSDTVVGNQVVNISTTIANPNKNTPISVFATMSYTDSAGNKYAVKGEPATMLVKGDVVLDEYSMSLGSHLQFVPGSFQFGNVMMMPVISNDILSMPINYNLPAQSDVVVSFSCKVR